MALDDGQNSLLLNGRRLVETISVNTSEDFLLESHVVESVDGLVPVGLQVFFIWREGQDAKTTYLLLPFAFVLLL